MITALISLETCKSKVLIKDAATFQRVVCQGLQ